MEIKGQIKGQSFMKIENLKDGATFAFCDRYDRYELFMKGSSSSTDTLLYAISLEDGTVYNLDYVKWRDRPIRPIKTVLTIC